VLHGGVGQLHARPAVEQTRGGHGAQQIGGDAIGDPTRRVRSPARS
jgi:hypothetical protein